MQINNYNFNTTAVTAIEIDTNTNNNIEIFNLDLKKMIKLWNERYKSFFGRLFGGFRKNSTLIEKFIRNHDDKTETAILHEAVAIY